LLVEKPAADIVPVADEPAATEPSVVHTEPLRGSTSEPQEEDTVSLSPVPVVDAEPPSPALPVIEEIHDSQVEAVETHSEPLSPDVKAELPAAPASVILSGETPGPSVLQTIIQASSTEHDISSNGSLSNDVDNVTHEKAHTGSDPVAPPGLYATLTPEKESSDSNDNSQENGHLVDS